MGTQKSAYLYQKSFLLALKMACLVTDTPPEVSFVAVENLCATAEGPSRGPQQNIYYKTEGTHTLLRCCSKLYVNSVTA
jgi:hypothetical protein